MRPLIWTFALLLFASSLGAQSLAEIAREEKERRKRVESSGHTYTEADLRSSEGPMTQVTGQGTPEGEEAEGAGEGEPASEESEAEPEDPRRTESYWRGRLEPIDRRIRDMEARLQSPEFTSNLNLQGSAARDALERELQQARAERQAILDEARREGVPPGWLR